MVETFTITLVYTVSLGRELETTLFIAGILAALTLKNRPGLRERPHYRRKLTFRIGRGERNSYRYLTAL